jgi:hypothetical protein
MAGFREHGIKPRSMKAENFLTAEGTVSLSNTLMYGGSEMMIMGVSENVKRKWPTCVYWWDFFALCVTGRLINYAFSKTMSRRMERIGVPSVSIPASGTCPSSPEVPHILFQRHVIFKFLSSANTSSSVCVFIFVH